MPVSKKRKKDGKPVHRSAPAPAPGPGEEGHVPAASAAPPVRVGKPANPFVAAQQARRASQRGR
ncbi:MAG TPA: hypothetical protein VFM45_02770 [Anaeromyxobacteraceae bacterium]|nr:hypothetical protein [Anaeromyxobacteraceae bacterium]